MMPNATFLGRLLCRQWAAGLSGPPRGRLAPSSLPTVTAAGGRLRHAVASGSHHSLVVGSSSSACRSQGFASSAASADSEETLRFCVVGSGPAGFYTADKLLKIPDRNVTVDIVDRLPTPFGLVRSGVAPDHPDTKAVVNRFGQILEHKNCSFFGNVTLGRDVSITELRERYHGVVLSYGAEGDRHLNVPGEELKGVFSAREMVWWYNGHPDYRNLPIDLTGTDTAVVFGLGNVAVDCARILLQDPDGPLRSTDITEHALEALRSSTIKKVYMVGRRGPVQGAFTPKELRELLSIPGTKVVMKPEDMMLSDAEKAKLKAGERKPRRTYEVLAKARDAAEKAAAPENAKELHLCFFRNPAALSGTENVETVTMEKTKLVDDRAVGTGEHEEIKAGLVLRSIGYYGLPVEGVPFDTRSGTVPNAYGKVLSAKGGDESVPGLYVCGWLKRGPSGIIGSNLNCADETVHCIRQDLEAQALPTPVAAVPGTAALQTLLDTRGVAVVSHKGWSRIDEEETARGQVASKPREKITSYDELLATANTNRS